MTVRSRPFRKWRRGARLPAGPTQFPGQGDLRGHLNPRSRGVARTSIDMIWGAIRGAVDAGEEGVGDGGRALAGDMGPDVEEVGARKRRAKDSCHAAEWPLQP